EAAMNIAMAIMGGGAISGALRGAGSLARNLWGRVATRVGSRAATRATTRAATRATTRATTRAATQAPPQPQVGRLNVLRNVYSTRTTTPSGVSPTGGIRQYTGGPLQGVHPGVGQPGFSAGQQNLAQSIARGSQAVQRATQAQPPGARLLQSIRTAGDNLSQAALRTAASIYNAPGRLGAIARNLATRTAGSVSSRVAQTMAGPLGRQIARTVAGPLGTAAVVGAPIAPAIVEGLLPEGTAPVPGSEGQRPPADVGGDIG